jgi:hypothetical protein
MQPRTKALKRVRLELNGAIGGTAVERRALPLLGFGKGGKGAQPAHKHAPGAATLAAAPRVGAAGDGCGGGGDDEELPGSFLVGSFAGSLGNLLGSFEGSTLSAGQLLGRHDSFEAGAAAARGGPSGL